MSDKTSYAMRVKLAHCINKEEVEFLRNDTRPGNALAQFEEEIGRIVAEETAEHMRRLREGAGELETTLRVADVIGTTRPLVDLCHQAADALAAYRTSEKPPSKSRGRIEFERWTKLDGTTIRWEDILPSARETWEKYAATVERPEPVKPSDGELLVNALNKEDVWSCEWKELDASERNNVAVALAAYETAKRERDAS